MLLNKISSDLSIPEYYLISLANSASHRYKSYKINKSDGKKRVIQHPSKELKVIQRYLLDNILISLPIHDNAAAYIKFKGLRNHVEKHKDSKFILRLDFIDFFPSLTSQDIQRHFKKYKSKLPRGWNNDDTHLLMKYVCRYNRLTIGAVTSPCLSNTLCFDLDTKVSEICDSKNIIYSRYADDMYTSSNQSNALFKIEAKITKIVKKLEYPSGLSINERKTNHMSKKHRRKITGLIITPDGNISIGRKKKRYLKLLVHKWDKLDVKTKMYLAGYLSYCMAVEPSFLDSLNLKFGSIKINEILDY